MRVGGGGKKLLGGWAACGLEMCTLLGIKEEGQRRRTSMDVVVGENGGGCHGKNEKM